LEALAKGARHVYDAAVLLDNAEVRARLQDGVIANLMPDIDARSATAGFPYTPRPSDGFGASPAFTADTAVADALRSGYALTAAVAWGVVPTFDEAVAIIVANSDLL
jgi:hypothetical protein